jgi:hypothetical protein
MSVKVTVYPSSNAYFLFLASLHFTCSSPHDKSHAAESKSKHTPFIAANINLTYLFGMCDFIVGGSVVYIVVVVWCVVSIPNERTHPHTNTGMVK